MITSAVIGLVGLAILTAVIIKQARDMTELQQAYIQSVSKHARATQHIRRMASEINELKES